MKKEGVSLLPARGLLGALVQLPVVLGMFYAVRRCVNAGGRFLWIANIARPDFLLAGLVALLTWATVALGSHSAPEQGRTFLVLFPAVMMFLVLLRLSAGIGLYWAASNLVGLVQAAIVGREALAAAK